LNHVPVSVIRHQHEISDGMISEGMAGSSIVVAAPMRKPGDPDAPMAYLARVRLVTWNVRRGGRRAARPIAEVLVALDAGVVVLTEITAACSPVPAPVRVLRGLCTLDANHARSRVASLARGNEAAPRPQLGATPRVSMVTSPSCVPDMPARKIR
jgi:hypothetical protein